MPPKSIFRQPGATHFQLVHRSQRDPLINDPDASKHVLKPFERENTKKGKSRADLETLLSPEEIGENRTNIGEASLYGVYFDDSEYDYMRHLRPVGMQEDGVESVLIEAPSTSKQKFKFKPKSKTITGIDLLDLPEGVLASSSELPRTYESQQAVPASIAGFQPDMDAHLRQVLEALEDDAFVEDELEDDFFAELVADGERGSDEEVNFEFREDGIDEAEGKLQPLDQENASWEERFANFKKSQIGTKGTSDDGYDSEGGDTVGTLPVMSVIGGKKRRKGASDASGYSMSSSSMFRNEALQTLDERFDQMILREYNEEEGGEDSYSHDGSDSDGAPDLITSRDDFDSMVNTFLNDFEILGRKMKPKMEGETGMENLDAFRRAMGQDERNRLAGDDEDEETNLDDLFLDEDKKDRWDCETILTTYTNLENHPRLIRARDPKPVPKIVLDRKTGLPSVLSKQDMPKNKPRNISFADSDDTDGSDTEDGNGRGQAVGRPRNETKEEKKARKASVKAERQQRRAEKKSTKDQFGAEVKDQKKRIANKELRLKKL
ncbi:Low temperature viability protein [Pholiota conissans]|uniref:Low temperature viability protein n=1 Tax=Pholiota conissans TaxID=109636 RepID=A0A9P5ZG64_9AGAR|nr:Low temperature viability protein [Pholiota conissans]